MRVLLALGLLCATAASAEAQPFSNANSSLAKYTIAEAMPSKACEAAVSGGSAALKWRQSLTSGLGGAPRGPERYVDI